MHSQRPPYVTYPALKTIIEEFAESTTPTKLNRHVLSKLSGAGYAELMSGLRYLGLVAKDDSVLEGFSQLVQAQRGGGDAYKKHLLDLLQETYEDIVKGVDIKKGTLPELEQAFKEVGVPQGQMMARTVRFYVKALQDCGFEVSPHITKPRRRTPRNGPGSTPSKGRKTPGIRREEEVTPPPPADKDHPPEGFDRLPIFGRTNAYIQFPADLTAQDCAVIEAAVGYLRALVKTKEGDE